jgi:uncharacterized protein (TIGR03086 family)
MDILTEIVELDRVAVAQSVEIVNQITAADLDRATPCEGWTVAELIAHMTAQHRGFAAAARGNLDDLEPWSVDARADSDPGAYARAADDVVAAFAGAAALERPFWLPEIQGGGPFPAATAVSFHFVDYVVHGWDVGASIGIGPSHSEQLLRGALAIARKVRTAPSAINPARPSLGPGPRGKSTPPSTICCSRSAGRPYGRPLSGRSRRSLLSSRSRPARPRRQR